MSLFYFSVFFCLLVLPCFNCHCLYLPSTLYWFYNTVLDRVSTPMPLGKHGWIWQVKIYPGPILLSVWPVLDYCMSNSFQRHPKFPLLWHCGPSCMPQTVLYLGTFSLINLHAFAVVEKNQILTHFPYPCRCKLCSRNTFSC